MDEPGRPTPNACRTGFRQWFWSFPFWFDLRIGGVDILPDPIGFLLVVRGASTFGRFHRLLENIMILGFILTAVSVLDVYEPTGSNLLPTEIGIFGAAVGTVMAILQCVLVWWMCQVVADFARRVHAHETIRAAEQRRMLFLAWQVATAVILLFAVIVEATPGDGVLFLALFFAGVAVLGLLMELMLQAQHLCRAEKPEFLPVPAPAGAPADAPTPARA